MGFIKSIVRAPFLWMGRAAANTIATVIMTTGAMFAFFVLGAVLLGGLIDVLQTILGLGVLLFLSFVGSLWVIWVVLAGWEDGDEEAEGEVVFSPPPWTPRHAGPLYRGTPPHLTPEEVETFDRLIKEAMR